MNRIELFLVLAVSFSLATAIGYSDYETKSLTHLFSAEWGNSATLAILTLVFSVFGGCGVVSMRNLFRVDGFESHS